MKRKAKYRVGQVVWYPDALQYLKVTAKFVCAEGVGRGLRWHYNVFNQNSQFLRDVSESELRPLTAKERGGK